jgi:DNA-binding IclR family transcriptional regulator
VWGNLGPTIVRLDEPVQPMHVNLRTGTVMSLASTATGRLFAAYMPPKVVEQALHDDACAAAASADAPTVRPVRGAAGRDAPHGLSRTLGQPIAGIDAFCAPVFDHGGNLVLGITAMGPAATFDSAWDGAIATPLLRCAGDVSARLGQLSA